MRKIKGALLAILFCPAVLLHAQDPMTVLRNAQKVINDLTADDLFGRGYVNGGDSLAADLLLQRIQDIGLQPFKAGFEQRFSFPVNTFPKPTEVAINGSPLVPGVDFIVDPASGHANGTFGIEPFDLQELVEGEAPVDPRKWEGKALLLKVPATKDRDSAALYHALIDQLMDMAPLIRVQEKLTWSVAQNDKRFPLIEVLNTAFPDSASKITLRIDNQFLQKHTARNLIGMIKGSKQPKEYVVLTAHYDHLGMMGPDAIFPGANDNASGVAMLLSLAEHYTRNPPDRSVVFMLFAGEEAGLVGSNHYVEHPLFKLDQIRFLINLDLLGTGDDGIMVVNATAQPREYDQLVALGEGSDRLPAVKKRGPACNSDHCAFVDKGVPAVFIYTLGGIAAYHDVHDRSETLPLTDLYDVRATLIDLINALE